MKLFLAVLALSSLCSAAPQFGFLPKAPLYGHLIGRPLVADLWSSEDFDPVSVEDDSSEEVVVPITLEQARVRLMRYMRELERDIEEDIFENDYLDVQSSLYKLNNRVWPKMVYLSDQIYDNLLLANDVKALEREHKIRVGLKRDVARIRFKTGTRKCPSPDESFFAPTKSSYPAKTYKPSSYSAPAYEAPSYSAPAYEKPETYKAEPYSFSWDVKDEYYNDYAHSETSDGQVVTGSYRIELPDGRGQTVTYRADSNGYVADVKYDGEAKYPPPDYKPAAYSAPEYKASTYRVPAYKPPVYKSRARY